MIIVPKRIIYATVFMCLLISSIFTGYYLGYSNGYNDGKEDWFSIGELAGRTNQIVDELKYGENRQYYNSSLDINLFNYSISNDQVINYSYCMPINNTTCW